MTPPATTPDQPIAPLRARARVGVWLLTIMTVTGLCGAWWWPERTEWHYLIVTQVIPLGYVGLAWWVARRRPGEGDDV
jgi:hypothetical protein